MNATAYILEKLCLALLYGALIGFIVLTCENATSARADVMWTPKAQMALTQCIYGEAGEHRPDWAPIAYVLQRRYQQQQHGWTLSRTIYQYCKSLRGRIPRQVRWLRMPFVRPHLELERWAGAFVSGQVPDPCPRAMHWGGPKDTPPQHYARVWCGRTKNIFYRVAR